MLRFGSGLETNLRMIVAAFLLFLPLCRQTLHASGVLVEAESFKALGGWVVDQQFMDQMGSPYLLAHGMGEPVKNAVTEVEVPQAGEYRIWVRTKDWVPPHHPGRFKVILAGKAVDKEFGTDGEGWLWQNGGTAKFAAGKLSVELQDLTGFEGRCDAIYLTTDLNERPPAKPDDAMRAWRRSQLGLPAIAPDAGEFDLVVIGGGTAGSCSAAAAAQKGLKIALIQDRPELGGVANAKDVGIHIEGLKGNDRYPAIHEITRRNLGEMTKSFKGQTNLTLFAWTHAFAVEKEGARISAVIAQNCLTGAELRFRAPLFVDCTGDATIGFLAGADFRYGREGKDETKEKRAPDKADKMHLGLSILWSSEDGKEPSSFPECPWAMPITADNYTAAADKGASGGGWNWETGFFDTVPEADETVRDRLFRAIYGIWDYQKNRAADKDKWASRRLARMRYIAGKRESRRLVGDVLLTEQDLTTPTDFPDGCVKLGWAIDLHFPTSQQTKKFPGEEFRSVNINSGANPKALVPFRCFYSRNVPNLMMAGRCISVTHVALGTTRVMGTGGQIGTVTGLAAWLCKQYGCTPRDLYEKHLDEFKALLKDPGVQTR